MPSSRSPGPSIGGLFLLGLAALGCSDGAPASPHAVDAGPPRIVSIAVDAALDTTHEEGSALPDVFVPNRPAGQRAPRSAACDEVDGTRCLLPWPSNAFTVADSTTETGLRVHVSDKGVAMTDDATSIDRADGFSRLTPILTGFSGTIDPTSLGDLTTGAVRLIVQQPGSSFGQLVPLRFDVQSNADATQSVIVVYERVPLAPGTDYTVVVTDDARLMDGRPLAPDHLAKIALGLTPPTTSSDAALYAYDAPAREAMKAAGIDPEHAVRVWDFTTRSLHDPTGDLTSMRATEIAAFDAASAGSIAIDTVTAGTGTVALIVEGRITGLPSYLTSTGSLSRDGAGAASPSGVHDAPFRVAIPVGSGDYRVVMYGHGTGGNYHDPNFDQQITMAGAVKVGVQFIGWTDTSIVETFASFHQLLIGSEISTAGLMQSVADATVIQHALGSALGDALAGTTIGGQANPAYGRGPNQDSPVWAGGSLGGTMGYVYSSIEPSIVAAVLNVPGAAWTHFVPYSTLFAYVHALIGSDYRSELDIYLGIATSQINWDPIDGAAWYDAVGAHFPVLLEQESIGDPVLPNIGDEMVAASSHADQVGVVLAPIVTCTDVETATAHNGMTQFKVPSSVTDPYDIHGFAANATPAGVAAQQQIVSFISSVWAGAPVISVPAECVGNTPPKSCDFSGQ